jgi:hypothetical protein
MKLSNLKRKSILSSFSSILLLFSVVAISLVTIMDATQSKENHLFQTSYAQTLRTMEVKLQFDKLVETGHTENIHVFVRDQATGLPISGANVRLTVTYVGGTPVRQFNPLTDANGLASLSLPISSNAITGSYALDTTVTSATGYQDTSIGTVDFAVMSHVNVVPFHNYAGHIHSSSIHGTHRHHH